ncbi:MAG: hypothetical protein HGA63_05080, partial [Syntrophobacteraceae bacterium]|nr:hypothetical protein [Syntrophobacteraceae bacterium]
MPPIIRVLLGKESLGTFRNKDTGLLHPEVLEAIAELRGEMYRKFGIIHPAVRFRDGGTGMKPDGFRIVLLNESKDDPTSRIVPVSPDGALPQFIAELRLRISRNRAGFIMAEDIAGWLSEAPDELSEWLAERYSLTDLKLILRAVIAPNQSELDCFNATPELCVSKEKLLPEQTLRYPSWLLKALVFWINAAGANNLEGISAGLRDTQRSRFNPSRDELPENETTALVRTGLMAFERSEIGQAVRFFSEALQRNRDEADSAFRFLYARETAVTFEGRAEELEQLCEIPEPGRVEAEHNPDTRIRCELEDLLEEAGNRLTDDQRHTLRLALYSKCKAEGLLTKTGQILEELRRQYSPKAWSPRHEYALAFWLLSDHGNRMTPPSDLAWIDQILHSAFGKLEQEQAETAFDKLLTGFYKEERLPSWFCNLLASLADTHPQSFWIPFYLGQHVGSGMEVSTAIRMLDRAQQNIVGLPSNEQERLGAWVALYRAEAQVTLGNLDVPEKRRLASENALLILENLAPSIPLNDDKWPFLGHIYRAMADAHLIVNDVDKAAVFVDKGLRQFPDDVPLLSWKFFLHLVKQETNAAFLLIRKAREGPIASASVAQNLDYLAAMLELLSGEDDWEYSARSFLATNHDYADYIRMMLYCNMLHLGKTDEAVELLRDRWRAVNPSSWNERLDQGDEAVLREKLIGYYLNEVPREEIFKPLEDEESFKDSPLSHIARSPTSLRCEAFFYDALLQGATGDVETRKARQVESLQRVTATHSYNYFEY